ncbi:MAG: hypothetical protein JJT88_09495 [Gammaproteobacteria bacterium]|nr:hypothetical protein [Gammaproteobacteria bacterium]
MTYLDLDKMAAIAPADFQNAEPYPWVNPCGLLQPDTYETLRRELPALPLFAKRFEIRRRHGQQPHDRYTLEYHKGSEVHPDWHGFIEELQSDDYRHWIGELFSVRRFFLTFHWHYTPAGCSVSPHCDATRKLGSHIFYFNTAEDWDPAWGGGTLILDDGGRLDPRSAPGFDAFDTAIEAEALGNQSLLFGRRGNSWHGVRELTCPPNRLRKVFIVVINRMSAHAFAKRWVARWRMG